ncbi:MAG: RagB/SusD family nutrient uptake outer membrane protein [Chitinophagaceae bacterium]|nr:RagB/SusD family nutrient uptake outer membrane protein [Chitinophagaceae bacterium]
MKKSVLILFCLAFFSGCNRDFLNKNPKETSSLNQLFATPEDLALAVNGIYDVFQGTIWGGSFFHLRPHFDGVTEDAIFCCPWEGSYQILAQGAITPSSGGIVDYIWDFGYKGISRANAVLANINRTDIVIPPNTRAKFEGETRFLRALMYFELANNYGDVPLLLAPVERKKSRVARTPKSQVIDSVIADLDIAIANLETTPFNGQIGRPTKQSALGLKTRVLLYNKKWIEAAATAKQVMDMEADGTVALSSNYEGLFNGTNKADKEVLFDVQFLAPKVGEGNYLGESYGLLGADNGSGWGSLSYQETMFDAFYMKDGKPITSSPMYDATNPYANRDPRFYWSFFVPGYGSWQGKPYTENNYAGLIADLPINTKKWVTEKDLNFVEEGNANLIILRYADVLLMYAEAQNESDVRDATVYAAINKIRSRAQMPDIQPGLSKDQMTDVIRHERKVEFSQEGLRYHDLVRWGIAEQLINANKRETRNYKFEVNKVLPIPQSEMDANPNLVQNPGY